MCREQDTEIYREWLVRSEVGLQFIWDRSDSPLNPTRGVRLTGDVRHASRFSDRTRWCSSPGAPSRWQRIIGWPAGVCFRWRVRFAGGSLRSGRRQFSLTPDDRLYGGGVKHRAWNFSHNELGPIVRGIDETFPDSIADLVLKIRSSRDGAAGYTGSVGQRQEVIVSLLQMSNSVSRFLCFQVVFSVRYLSMPAWCT